MLLAIFISYKRKDILLNTRNLQKKDFQGGLHVEWNRFGILAVLVSFVIGVVIWIKTSLTRQAEKLATTTLELELKTRELIKLGDLQSKTFKTSPDAIVIHQLKNFRISDVNQGFTKLVGYSREEIIGKSAMRLGLWVNIDDQKRLARALRQTDEIRNFETQLRSKNRGILACQISARKTEVGGEDSVLTIIRDVTDKKRLEDELQRLSTYDYLTQIPNRRSFYNALNREWDRAKRERQSLSLAVVDIDFFRSYNDCYGYIAGDYCLQAVAGAMNKTLRRPADFCARFGGDEFVIVLPNTDPQGARIVLESVKHAVQELKISHAVSTVDKFVTISVGIAASSPANDSMDSDNLLRRADKALYKAKKQEIERVVVA